jgi:hypothetical protein
MPHAVIDVTATVPVSKTGRKSKSRSPSRELQQLQVRFEEVRAKYSTSQFASSIEKLVRTASKISGSSISRVLSLGLGSLAPIKTQTRRLKQLAIFLAIADALELATGKAILLFAQDPSFTRADEAFLSTFGIAVVRTPSGAELGEARDLIDAATLVYSPFLTLEAYEQLLLHAGKHMKYIIGDDFNALLSKWPKHSAEEEQVKGIMKGGILRYKRRVVSGEEFWDEEDKAFPMAMYSMEERSRGNAKM